MNNSANGTDKKDETVNGADRAIQAVIEQTGRHVQYQNGQFYCGVWFRESVFRALCQVSGSGRLDDVVNAVLSETLIGKASQDEIY